MNVRAKQTVVALAVLVGAGFLSSAAAAAEPTYLYQATFIRAAPGKLLELIDLFKGRMDVIAAGGDEKPFWWRHTQGDQWDLMLLFPMESYSAFYAPDRVARRAKAAGASALPASEFKTKLGDCTAWREDMLVYGPPLETVRQGFTGTSFYHLEIFASLPGKQAALYRQREMEGAYQVAIGRPGYMIFVRDLGAPWDIFTLDCYRDQKHWSESGDISKEKRDRAARQAGFESSDAIGPTMRTLADFHRDTQGVAIR
jgi:hypothetical protein